MVRRMLPIALGWTARVGGWGLLLGLITYSIANHQGMEVRGQVARLRMPSERDDALGVLLHRADLDDVPNPELNAVSYFIGLYSSPFMTLVRRPCHFSVNTNGTDMPGVSELFVVFDADGKLAGAPVEWTPSVASPDNVSPRVVQIVDESDSSFLILSEWRRLPTEAGVASITVEVYYHIYRLKPAESPSVLTIMVTRMIPDSPEGTMLLGVVSDRQGRIAAELLVYGGTGEPVRTAVATFVWDSERERFIEPPPDPQGRWRVVD